MDFNSFKNEWLGRRVDYDHVFNYQCVDLIQEYVAECYGITSGVSGNAIDYWNNPSASLLSKFHKDQTSAADQSDIVVFNGLPGNPYGHIGIATGNINATDVEVLEQNGATGDGSGTGSDAIRVRYISRDRVAGILRPNAVVPVASPVEVHPYTIETITPKQIIINKNTHEWGMTYDNFTAIANNPIQEVAQGTIITVNAICHHNIGYNYYLPDANDPAGYNVLDCDDYSPPVPAPEPVAPPVPYVPPAAPVPVKLATQIPLVVSVPVYANAHDADVRNVEFSTGEFLAGTYYQFGTENGMVNIGITNQDTATVWMNPLDNILAPQPTVVEAPAIGQQVVTSVPELDPEPATETDTSWKQSYIPFYPSGTTRVTRSIIYDVKVGGTVTDFGGTGPTMELTPGSKIGIYGKFYGPDGVHYYRPRIPKDTNFDYFYGIPISYNGRAILTLPPVSWLDKIWHKGMVLKSIFTEEEPKYIDSVLLKAFKRSKK